MSHRTVRTLALLAAACAALLVLAAPGMARGRHGDRNHDGISDGWERAHHLSLKVNQARRDQDHDGLRNKAEFLAGTNPRKADSDGDGRDDGNERAGQVVSLQGGVLTLHLFTGDDVKGKVDQGTEIKCDRRGAPQPPTPRTASDGPGAGHGDDQGSDDQGDNNDQGDDDQGDDDSGGGQSQAGCDASLLNPGQVVQEAELKASSGGLIFTEIKLVR